MAESTGGQPPTGEAEAGAAGFSEDAGAPPTAPSARECRAPYANCDASSLTPCETDTSRSAPHCGGCNKKCTGICKDGECLQPTSLFEGAQTAMGGLVRVGTTWYALTNDGLLVFDEATKRRSVRLSGPTGFNRLEAGLDRMYLGIASETPLLETETSWWSLPYAGGVVSDEQLAAFALSFVSSNLYFLQADQTLYKKEALGGAVTPYCKLPSPAFELASASIALPVVFRSGLGKGTDSDIVDCTPSEPAQEGPISGKIIRQGGYRTLPGRYQSGRSYWDEAGERLNVTDASGATRVLFEAIRDEDKLTDFVVRGRFVYASFGGSYSGGLRIIPIDEPDYFELVGTFRRPSALVIDATLDRLCYSDEYMNRVACIPFAAISP